MPVLCAAIFSRAIIVAGLTAPSFSCAAACSTASLILIRPDPNNRTGAEAISSGGSLNCLEMDLFKKKIVWRWRDRARFALLIEGRRWRERGRIKKIFLTISREGNCTVAILYFMWGPSSSIAPLLSFSHAAAFSFQTGIPLFSVGLTIFVGIGIAISLWPA